MLTNAELARQNMIENQVRPWEVLDPRVLDVLAAVRREDFVPARYRKLAFADMALPIGHGETMMKPTVEGRLLQALDLAPTIACSRSAPDQDSSPRALRVSPAAVTSIEMHADLADAARARIAAAGAKNVRIEVADAMRGLRDAASASTRSSSPARSMRCRDAFRAAGCAPGGRLFAIVGESPAMQAMLFTRADESHWREESLFETDLRYLTHAEPPRRFAL